MNTHNLPADETVLPWWRKAVPILFLGLAAVLVTLELHHIDLRAAQHAIAVLPLWEVLVLLLLGFAAVGAMTLYDALMCRWLQISIPWRQILQFSFVANTLNNMASLSGITGSSIRFILLKKAGVPDKTAATYAGLVLISIPLGLGLLALLMLFFGHAQAALDLGAVRVIMVVLALLLLAFLLVNPSRMLAKLVPIPDFLDAKRRLVLVLVSGLDWALAAIVAWVCARVAGADIEMTVFFTAFVLASLAGMLSMLPGGLGVFDGALLVLLSAQAESGSAVVAGLVLYRVVYFLVPVLAGTYVGAGLLAGRDQSWSRQLMSSWAEQPLLRLFRAPVLVLSNLSIKVLGYLTFLAGLVLLLSTVFPVVREQILLVKQVIPLMTLEGSHVLSIAIGVSLLALARGIADRVRGAYRATMVVLIVGAILSVLRGLDIQDALLLLAVAGLLRMQRPQFDRTGFSLWSERSILWLASIAVALFGYYVLGTVLYTHVPYSGTLWTEFGYHLDAARFLRSLVVVVVAMLGVLGWGLFRLPRPPLTKPLEQELQRAEAFLHTHGGTNFAHLIWMGDKHLFFTADQKALIAFGSIRDRLVALGDPHGDGSAIEPAIVEFRGFADRYNLVPLFYEVSDEHLHAYHDAGFGLFKIGESARVPIAEFSLTGKRGESLRHSMSRAKREALSFEMLTHPLDETTWETLQRVSDAWLAIKAGVEKKFSLGRFDRQYLSHSPIAVVRKDGVVIAFANLMPDYGSKQELTIDLMRHVANPPPATMDFLFVQLVEYAREQGYAYFGLGMAPLSGVGETEYARRSERVARLAYLYGNHFYNYKGLRSFKEKFNPQWRSAYIAYPLGATLPGLLIDVAALIAGSYRGILRK